MTGKVSLCIHEKVDLPHVHHFEFPVIFHRKSYCTLVRLVVDILVQYLANIHKKIKFLNGHVQHAIEKRATKMAYSTLKSTVYRK